MNTNASIMNCDTDILMKMKRLVFLCDVEFATKEEITSGIEMIDERINDIKFEIEDIEKYTNTISVDAADNLRQEALKRKEELEAESSKLVEYRKKLENSFQNYKNFKKGIFFRNLRALLKNKSDVKVGQIEREANVRLGYTARLEKEDNTAEPSMEFVVTAAKLLGVCVDTMIKVDVSEMTSTELYLVKFFDKLMQDTIKDTLDWNRETSDNLNRMNQDMIGYIRHPLFNEETFMEETESDYPEEVTRVVFSSKSFGQRTYIAGDCFNLSMKNNATLYLMNVEKSVHRVDDTTVYAKEAWLYVPFKGCSYLVGTKDNNPLASLLEELYATVKERMEHPKINEDVRSTIDAFLYGDMEGEKEDVHPFN